MFTGTEILYNDLGGQGPLFAPKGVKQDRIGIRYVNVGTSFDLQGNRVNVDLVVTPRTTYSGDSSMNGLASGGKLAQINVACNTFVTLRVTTTKSCSGRQSCKICDGLATQSLIDACYFQECSCFGATVQYQTLCSGGSKETARLTYSCNQIHETVVLPSEALVTMTVFDLDNGPNGDYQESLYLTSIAYEKTPLRPTSDATVTSAITVTKNVFSQGDILFTSQVNGDLSDNPSDPLQLSDEQAAKGVQVFFQATQGYVEATFRCAPAQHKKNRRTTQFHPNRCLRAYIPPLSPLSSVPCS